MTGLKAIARKRLLFNKTETAFVVAVISIVVAILLVSLSVSINYFELYLTQAQTLTGNSLEEVIDNGFSNMSEVGEYIAEFAVFFRSYSVPSNFDGIIPPPSANNSDSLFAPIALVENLPFTIIFMLFIVFCVARVSLSIVFSACKRERAGFFSLLLVSGATDKQIKKCAFYEGVYYCLVAIPIGSVLGVVGIYGTEMLAHILFENLNTHYGILTLSADFSFSLMALIVVTAFVFLSVCMLSKKACKRLSVKTTATQLRQTAGTDIGLCTFTANPRAYRRRGIEYYIAIRNFQNNFGKYFKIITMTVLYTAIAGLTFVIFNVIRNYNNQEILFYSKDLVSFTFSFQYYFGLVAVCLCFISVISTFVAVFTNINSNVSEYAVMVSSGSSKKSVLRAVRIEGVICSLSGVLVSLISILYSLAFFMEIYSNDNAMNFGSFENAAIITAVSLSLFFVSVIITTVMINRKMKNLDVIKTLKDYFY